MTTLPGLALHARRRLDESGRSLATSLQRLSSGLRVNSARDDAAGLAIAERMLAQQRGMGAGLRNAQDAIGLLQTADGALAAATGLLQRLRELAVQAASGSLGGSDRALLQREATGLVGEIDRLGRATTFNGLPLLDGSFEQMALQVGAGSGDRLGIGKLVDLRAAQLPTLGISLSINDGIDTRHGPDGAMPASGLTAISGGLTVAGADGTAYELAPIGKALTGVQRLNQVVAAINARQGDTGIAAQLSAGTAPGTYKVTMVSDRAIGAGDFGGFSAAVTGIENIADGPVRAEPLDELDLSTAAGARLAMQRYDKAIGQVTAGRATLGALQSRLDSVISQLRTTSDAQQAARSRILDADYAAETAQRSRAEILQRSALAMLAQATQQPAGVLQLLRLPGR